MNWRDAYEEQMTLYDWCSSARGKQYLREFIESAGGVRRQSYQTLTLIEEHKLASATPVFVAGEMCQLISFASESFEPEPWASEDLICPHGFVYYEKPMQIEDRHRQKIEIAAFSFGALLKGEATPSGKEITIPSSGVALTLYSRHRGALIPIHMQPVWFGMTFENEDVDVDDGTETGARAWWVLAQATLRMMQQHVAVRQKVRPERGARRRAKRKGLPEMDTVVVRLRRKKTQTPEGHVPEAAHYSHRFLRVGHWRWQFYPSVDTHRQIWIHETVVGDEHLPLLIKGRAFNWDR